MLSLFKVFMAPDVSDKLKPVLESGYITQGKKVEEYESALQDWFDGYPFILSLNSATSGLTLAVRLLNLKSGDEILCTPLTCTASNFPVLANNLNIRWVDVDPNTCNMDLDDLESKITEKTKAILVVHWGGSPNDMAELNRIRDTYKIPIIEDCAHAFGAKFCDRYIGTHGNMAVFSTQAIKHLTTGDGGLIFLPTLELYERAKLLRWYGISREARSGGGDFRMEPDIEEWGYKFHMNDINATIGLANLPYIDSNLERARSIAETYHECITVLDNINDAQYVTENKYRKYDNPPIEYEPSYWLYTIKVPNKKGFMKYMKKNGIMTSQVHNRNDVHSCVAQFKDPYLPQLDQLEQEIVCIPIGWWVTDEECEKVMTHLRYWDTHYRLYNDFSIRPILPSDRSYLDLMQQLSKHLKGKNFEYAEAFEERLRKINAQSQGTIYVISRDGCIIATGKLFIELKFGDPVGHIEDVVVDQEWRGIGLGKMMVNKLVEMAQTYKCHKVILDANDSLNGFYTGCGFNKEGGLFARRLEL